MKRLIPILIICIATAAWWYQKEDKKANPRFSGTMEAKDSAVGSRTGGRVIFVAVKEGDVVKEGQILVRLDSAPLEAKFQQAAADFERSWQKSKELENGTRLEEIEQAEASYEKAKSQWQLMKNGARTEDIAAAKANLEARKAELQLAQITEKRQTELFANKNTSAENLDRAHKELAVSQNLVHAAEADLQRLLAGFRVEDIQSAKAQMDMASAALTLARKGPREEQTAQAHADMERVKAVMSSAQIDLAEAIIKAPTDGVVETSNLEPGDMLSPNQTAITMILYKPLTVRIYVPESFLNQVPVGKEVMVSAASFPGKTFSGKIEQVNQRAEFTPRNVQTPETRDDLVFGVKIEINDPNHLLRPGMVADVSLNNHVK